MLQKVLDDPNIKGRPTLHRLLSKKKYEAESASHQLKGELLRARKTLSVDMSIFSSREAQLHVEK